MRLATRLSIAVALTLAIACGGPPPAKIDRVYEGLADPLPRIDASILDGRSVLIDPGHGGHFRGTVGQDSLEESVVNLGVSLYLWGLLREAGADVWLTRAIDRDFLAPEDSSLATDLQARVDMADTLLPDVFVSIHHNAQPKRNPEYNRVETYYKTGDPASLDLAFAIHRHLMRNLGIDHGEVRQGNYYVLRNNDAPSVLGESSYLTHPPVEKKLRLSDAQRLEAEAYFLGILDFFSRGLPRITKQTVRAPGPVPPLVYAVADDGGIGIDPDGVSFEVNGLPARVHLEIARGLLHYRFPWDAANDIYTVAVTVRNLLGNTSPVFRDTTVVDLPPKTAVFDNVAAAPGSVARVRARILDRRGVTVREGTPVTVASTLLADTLRTAVREGRVDVPIAIPDGARDTDVTLSSRGEHFTTHLNVLDRDDGEGPFGSYKPLLIVDVRDQSPILSAAVTWHGRSMAAGAIDGRYYVPAGMDENLDPSWSITAPGYVPVEFTTAVIEPDTVLLTPWFGGALLGKRFVLDPEGGRARDIGMGPLGLSASQVNLRVANYLAAFLRNAGAVVLLTRTTEEVRTPEDIARMTNRWGANRYIEIRHRSEPEESTLAIKTFHFPGSRNGKRLATDLSASMERRLRVPARAPADLVTYPLQQTACPAVVVEAPSISKVEEELRLDEPWYLREQAYAVFLGLLEHYAAPPGGAIEVVYPNQPNWLVNALGTWNLLTGPDGRAVFERLPPAAGGLGGTIELRKGETSLRRGAVIEVDDTTRVIIEVQPGDE